MFILNPYTAKPNTIIGGVGGTITTKSALATKLGISESRISNFKIIDNDIYCNIVNTYQLPVGCFQNDTVISSYIDLDGLVTLSSAVFQNSNIRKAVFPRIGASVDSACFQNSMLEEYTGGHNGFSSNAFDGCVHLHTIDAPNVKSLLTYSLRNTTSLTDANFIVNNIGTGALASSTLIADLSEVTQMLSNCINNCLYETLYIPNIVEMTAVSPIRGQEFCTEAFLNNLGNIGDSSNFFTGWSSAELIEMKKLKTYGAYASGGGTGVQYGFQTLKTGCTMRVNVALATANSGNPHEAFVWVKANRSAIVEFYDDLGNYVSTL